MVLGTQAEEVAAVESSGGRVGPGVLLYKARLARNLSAESVAAELFLDAQLIADLERDRFDRMPPPTYVRGYLKAYARFVGLDEMAIVNAYEQLTGKRGVTPEFKGQVYGKPTSTKIVPRKRRGVVGWLLLLLLAGSGGFAWLNRDDLMARLPAALSGTPAVVAVDSTALSPPPVEVKPVVVTPELHSPGSNPVVTPGQVTASPQPTIDYTPPSDVGGSGAEGVVAQDHEVVSINLPTPAATPLAPAAIEAVKPAEPTAVTPVVSSTVETVAEHEETPPAVSAPASTGSTSSATSSPAETIATASENPAPTPSAVTANSPETTAETTTIDAASTANTTEPPVAQTNPDAADLALFLTRESWVQIKDANGKSLAYGILSPGEQHAFSGKPPFRVTLGYAIGAQVSVNGQPFELASYIDGNVAKFEIKP